ncbi:tRNA (guanosine(37)-N1)-methyltransferase TrmD [Candidatus Margulisiibacteriota bacterium]
MLRIDVLTLFPEMFTGIFQSSILKRAHQQGACQLQAVNLRDYAKGKHRQADDRPYGGGAGMILMPEPIFEAVDDLRTKTTKVLLTCPRGELFNQNKAKQYSQQSHLIIICGHYEGVDERVRSKLVDEVVSIGDYVLTGGEVPAIAIVDATIRLLPEVLGNNDSLSQGVFPQYTRPDNYRGMNVPEVLLSGDHEKIKEWRRKEDRR